MGRSRRSTAIRLPPKTACPGSSPRIDWLKSPETGGRPELGDCRRLSEVSKPLFQRGWLEPLFERGLAGSGHGRRIRVTRPFEASAPIRRQRLDIREQGQTASLSAAPP